MDSSTRRRQERRLALVQSLSLGASCGSAVLFGELFLAGGSVERALSTSLAVALLAAGIWSLYRRRVPASVDMPEPETEPEPEAEAEGGWTVLTLMITAIGVVTIVVLGTLAQFILPLGILGAFWVLEGDVPIRWLIAAIAATLGTLFVVEFGIALPLCRRWRLPFG